MEFMAKAFIENKINGCVLIALTEEHMKEMGCCVLGECLRERERERESGLNDGDNVWVKLVCEGGRVRE